MLELWEGWSQAQGLADGRLAAGTLDGPTGKMVHPPRCVRTRAAESPARLNTATTEGWPVGQCPARASGRPAALRPACWRGQPSRARAGTRPGDRALGQRSEPWTSEETSVGSHAGRSLRFTSPPSYVVGVERNVEGFPEEGRRSGQATVTPASGPSEQPPGLHHMHRRAREGPGEDPGHVPATATCRESHPHWGSGPRAGKA